MSAEVRTPTAISPSNNHRGTSRILIVDDHSDAVESLALLIRHWGHQVESALDGKSALEKALTFKPKIILMDLGLPDIDGYKLARHFRNQSQLASAHLIALTGYASSDDRRRALDAGFNQHLAKPVDPEILQEMLGTIADKIRDC
jgi:CheY-like chemotaxis protein